MHVLVIIPDNELRARVRELLKTRPALFAKTYAYGLVMAEQDWVTDAIVWSPKGLDLDVIWSLQYLRRLNRDVRLFVVTPERTGPAKVSLTEEMEVDGYAAEDKIERVVQDVLGVPVIEEREETPLTLTHGSSAGKH